MVPKSGQSVFSPLPHPGSWTSTALCFLTLASPFLPPSLIHEIPYKGRKDQTTAPDTKGPGFLGARLFTALRGSPRGLRPPSWQGQCRGPASSLATKRAGLEGGINVHPRIPGAPQPQPPHTSACATPPLPLFCREPSGVFSAGLGCVGISSCGWRGRSFHSLPTNLHFLLLSL